MRDNPVIKKLARGEPVFTTWLDLNCPLSVEIMAQVGFDALTIDVQHGHWDYSMLLNAFQVMTHTATLPFARVPVNEFSSIGRILDLGAMGLVVPMVNTAEDAQRAVDATYFGPLGSRSLGALRMDIVEAHRNYVQEANSKIFLAVQIESVQAVNNVEEIAAVEDIHCLFVGPGDLSVSMGANAGSDEHEGAIQHVVEVANNHGKYLGIYAEIGQIPHRLAQGFQFIVSRAESDLLLTGATDFLRDLLACGAE